MMRALSIAVPLTVGAASVAYGIVGAALSTVDADDALVRVAIGFGLLVMAASLAGGIGERVIGSKREHPRRKWGP